MKATVKKAIVNTASVFAMAMALLAIVLTTMCIVFQATPADLYARVMNRPMETPLIQVQTPTEIEHEIDSSNLS